MMKNIVISILLLFTPCIQAKITLPDSLLTEEKAIELTICSPDTSHAIIQTLRQRELVPLWRLDCLEAEYFINQRQYRRAFPLFKNALDNSDLADSTFLQMKIMMHLMYVCDKLSEDDELTEYIFRLEKLTDKIHSNYFKAHTMFMFGKRLYYHGDSIGLSKCEEAVNLLRNVDHILKNNSLRSFYGDMVLIYRQEGRYSDAIRMSLLQEEISRVSSHIKMRYVDSRALRITYALRASLYADMGDFENADIAYNQFLKLKGGNAIDDKYIIDYLEAKGLYEEALGYIHAYKHHLTHEGDSISHWMLSMLGHESILYGMIDKYQESIALARQIKSLTETLHQRESHSMMTAVLSYLKEKDDNSRHDLIKLSIGFMGVFMALGAMGFFFYTIYHYRHRKKAEEKALNKNISTSGEGSDADEMDENDAEWDEEFINNSGNNLAFLYKYMDRIVTRDKLFLKPDLNREDLTRLLGIDKNRFGKMMTQYSGSSNINVYINNKRAEYAANLIKQHPEYTIATIAEMSGVASTVNFNRIFRSVYGVTPSEYRDNPVKKHGER